MILISDFLGIVLIVFPVLISVFLAIIGGIREIMFK